MPNIQPANAENAERRRSDRIELTLPGRYMLSDRREYPCWTKDISPCGVAVLGLQKGLIGEPIIAHFDQLGRIEGAIARNFDSCFAIKMQLAPKKQENFAQTLGWLVLHRQGGSPDKRIHERVKPYYRRTTMILTEDGNQYRSRLIDLSVLGAAFHVDAAPPIGSSVFLGKTPARVVRCYSTGIAVKFDQPLPEETLEYTKF